MLNLIAAARAAGTRRKALSGRGFYLESEPLPKVLPSQGLGDGDDEVQELVADGPRDELPSYLSDCHHCGAQIRWKPPQALRSGLWVHVGISGLDHDAEPLRIGGYTEQPPMRIEDAMAKFEEAVISGASAAVLPTGVCRELTPAELAERNARWQQAVDVAVGVPATGRWAPSRPSRPGRPSTPDYGGELTDPTPLADDLRADRERLLAANGTLARRVRLLESQLRAAGIEPAARE